MNLQGKKVALLVDNYFEQAEFEEPLSALKDAGAEVVIIGATTKDLIGLHHVEEGDTFQADLLLENASSEDYDALVLPGGAINADSLRMNEAAQTWVKDFLEEEKPLAVICHAPWLLVSADVLDGRLVTSYHAIQDDITNAGGEWVDRPVVVDGTLITSRQPDDLPMFNDALIAMLGNGSTPGTSAESEMTSLSGPDGSSEVEAEEESRLRSLGYDKNRDELTDADRRDILADDEDDDPDVLRSSQAVSADERDGTE